MTNILMLSIDDLNDWTAPLGGYGGVVYTPNIDRIAAGGTSFSNMFASEPGCNQSRTSALSGMSPLTTGVVMNNQFAFDYVDPLKTLPAVLKAAGYQTATAGKVFHELPEDVAALLYDDEIAPENPPGQLDKDPGSFTPTGTTIDAGVFTGDPERLSDAIITNAVADFLAGYEPDPATEGLFLSVGLSRPHAPWNVPQEYFDLYPLDEIVLPEVPADDLADIPAFGQSFTDSREFAQILAAGEYAKLVQGYLAAVSFADAMVGRLLAALEASAIANDTVLVLWSDNGYALGPKENIGKGALWDQTSRVQFTVWDPRRGGTTGELEEQPVSLLDLMPTVLDYAGVPAPAYAEGQSLRQLIETGSDDALRGYAITNIRGSYSLRTNEYRYTRYEDGSEELYDLRADPDEFDNLADRPAQADEKAVLSTILDGYLDSGIVVQNFTATPEKLVARQGERMLIAGFGHDTLVGGAADNVYLTRDAATTIVERASGGIDTVLARDSFVLPKNVENLRGAAIDGPAESADTRTFIGNKLDNRIAIDFKAAIVDARGGDDTIDGALDDDSLAGGRGDDSVFGDKGADTLDGGNGDDTVRGGEGDDRYVLAAGRDLIIESDREGFDTVDISAWGFENTQIEVDYGDSGARPKGLLLTNWLTGDRTTIGVRLSDLGVESITDGTETRTLTFDGAVAADGGRTIFGGQSDDTLSGTGGRDLLRGGAGDDVLQGGAADDVLEGGAGNDTLDGGNGRNTASYVIATAAVRLDLDARGSQVTGGAGTDVLTGIVNLVGSAFADTLSGSGRDNSIAGGDANDCIAGGDGDDTLDGGSGRDTIIGGPGGDVLIGGGGGDRFVFASLSDDTDRIVDFVAGAAIVLSAIDADATTPRANNAFVFIGDAAFTAAGQARAVQAGDETRVELNVDDALAADFLIRLDGLLTLTAADFVL